MPYRYLGWESTQSMPLSSVSASTPTTTTTTTATIIRTSTNPYKRVTYPFATTSVSKYTRTIINNLHTDWYKSRYSNNSNNDSDSGTGGGVSTTTRRSINFFNSYYTVSTTPKVTYGPKLSPFKYKNPVGVMSLSTTTKGYQNGLRNDGRGKRILYHRCTFFFLCIFFLLSVLSSDSRDESLILHDFHLLIIAVNATDSRRDPTVFFLSFFYFCPHLQRRILPVRNFSRDIGSDASLSIVGSPTILG